MAHSHTLHRLTKKNTPLKNLKFIYYRTLLHSLNQKEPCSIVSSNRITKCPANWYFSILTLDHQQRFWNLTLWVSQYNNIIPFNSSFPVPQPLQPGQVNFPRLNPQHLFFIFPFSLGWKQHPVFPFQQWLASEWSWYLGTIGLKHHISTH